MNKASLYFLLLGITLVIAACSAKEAKLTEEEAKEVERIDKEIGLGKDDDHKVDKRAAEDEEDGSGKKKKNKKRNKSGGSTTAAPDGSSTTTGSPSSTTTGSPDSTTSGKPKSKKDKGGSKLDSAADDEFYDELISDRDEEKVLISKAAAAIKSWAGWLEAHDKRTLNRNVANNFLAMVNMQLINKYRVGAPVCGSGGGIPGGRGSSSSQLSRNLGRQRTYDFSSLN